MAAAHKPSSKGPLPDGSLDRSRRIRRSIRKEVSEVDSIVESLRRCRQPSPQREQPRFSFRDTPTNVARPMSNARNRAKAGKMQSAANGSFADPGRMRRERAFGESRRYKSAARGHNQNMALADSDLVRAQLYSSQAYGTAIGTDCDPTQELYFHSRKNSKTGIEEEPKRADDHLTQLRRAYNVREEPRPRMEGTADCGMGPAESKAAAAASYIRTRCAKSCSRGTAKEPPKVAINPQAAKNARQLQYKGSLAAGQRRLVTAFNDCTYGKETTKSSDRTSVVKGSIKNGGKSSLNMSYTQCVDNDSLSFNNVSVLTQINSAMGSQENQSVEDIHYYFVAFYQRTKRMLSKVECGHKMIEGTGTDDSPQPARLENGSIVSVQDTEGDEEESQ